MCPVGHPRERGGFGGQIEEPGGRHRTDGNRKWAGSVGTGPDAEGLGLLCTDRRKGAQVEQKQTEPEPGGGRSVRGSLAVALVVVSVITAWALVEALGDDLRRLAMIETAENPNDSLLEFEDGASEAAAFFGVRDTVRFATPRTMTLAELLEFYHLENNPGAREALEHTLGTSDVRTVVPEGTSLVLPLTPTRVDQP